MILKNVVKIISIAHHAVAEHLASVEEESKSDAIDPGDHREAMKACRLYITWNDLSLNISPIAYYTSRQQQHSHESLPHVCDPSLNTQETLTFCYVYYDFSPATQ